MHLLLFLAFFQFQSQEIPSFEVITTQSGLSNSIVYDIYQDSEGYIWMATDNGLNRFDGYQFEVFYSDDRDSTTISSNIVRSIREDKQGRLWISTFSGLNLFDRKTKTFTRYIGPASAGIKGLDMQQIQFDLEGRLWFNALSIAGWFDTNEKVFHLTETDYVAYSLTMNNHGEVWSLSRSGSLYKLLAEEPISIVKVNENFVKHQIHVGAYTQRLWLNRSFDLPGELTEPLPELPGGGELEELLETDSATLWIGTSAGLFRYHRTTSRLEKVDFKDRSSTLTESIKSLYQDRSGAVWVGTLNGVFHFDPYQKPFDHIDVEEESNDVVMGMAETSYGLFVNVLGKGLYLQNEASGTFQKVRFPGMNLPQYNYVWDIEEIPGATYPLWLSTNEGLILYNPSSGNWRRPNFPVLRVDENISFAIEKTASGPIWVSSTKDLHRVDRKSGEILETISLKESVRESNIQDLAQVGQHVFISTESAGLLVYNPLEKSIHLLSDLTIDGTSLSGMAIWDLFSDGHLLWIGTKAGLYQLDTEQWKLNRIDLGANGQNSIIFSIEKTNEGLLWMGTENGLASYNIASGEADFYNTSDGVTNTEFNRKSIVRSEDDMLWLGGVNGITRFNPREIRKNPLIPPVYITGMEVITPDTTFRIETQQDKTIRLPWYQNTVVLEYVGLNYTNPGQNQYQYILEGYDPEWSTVTGLTARYVQLPAGKYTFLVKAANNDGLWNPDVASLQIQVLPPFWETFWFRLLVVLSIALLLWLSYRYRVRRLLEVERMRLRIAGDLHDEVGSGLSGIALTGDLLGRQAQKGAMKPELVTRITTNARNLASSLDSIVWLIDPKKETLGDFLTKAKLVANELLGETTLVVDEEVPATDRGRYLNPEQKRNLFLLIKESLNNVAKHAEASQVHLSLMSTKTHFCFDLTDNGKGFDTSTATDRHGLKSMHHRATELQATFKIESSPGKGTSVQFLMKLP